jgi:hypothetical protein
MDKNIGFIRKIKLDWLDAVAAYVSNGDEDQHELRTRLDPVLSTDLTGKDSKRKTSDVLITIWLKNKTSHPDLHQFAVNTFLQTNQTEERLWLHYGLTILSYEFFVDCMEEIGKLARHGELINNKKLTSAIMAKRGQLGSLERTIARVNQNLREWDILIETEKRYTYQARLREFKTENQALQAWMIACLLTSKQVQQMPYEDILRQPGLFPFNIDVSVDYLKKAEWLNIYRQGAGYLMVERK